MGEKEVEKTIVRYTVIPEAVADHLCRDDMPFEVSEYASLHYFRFYVGNNDDNGPGMRRRNERDDYAQFYIVRMKNKTFSAYVEKLEDAVALLRLHEPTSPNMDLPTAAERTVEVERRPVEFQEQTGDEANRLADTQLFARRIQPGTALGRVHTMGGFPENG